MSANPGIKDRASQTTPASGGKEMWLAMLEQGADMLQSAAPLKDFDVYVVGFHCAQGQPDFQIEAHHFCEVVNDDLLQCVLLDGNTKDANFIGIEYIVSEALFESMPQEEKGYWHPHNYEVFSGQLAAPGMPRCRDRFDEAAGQFLWQGMAYQFRQPTRGMDLPFGDPKLMCSFNRDGECDEDLRLDRDIAIETRCGREACRTPRGLPGQGAATVRRRCHEAGFRRRHSDPGVVDVVAQR